MSTNMLKMIGVAELPRVHQNPPAARAHELRAALQGRDIAATGDGLPQTAQQNETEDTSKVEKAVNQVNEFVQNLSRDLQFMVDDDSGRTVIKVLDTETKEVIRQIPPEELLRIATYLTDTDGSSLLLKDQA